MARRPSRKKSKTRLEHDLGHAELQVLTVLWEEAPCTVREVLNHLHQRGRNIAYTTVMTFLARLEQKGYVTSDKSGVAYVYRPTVERENVSQSRISSLIQLLYDGSAAPLVLELMENESFSREEIDQLQALIERLDREHSDDDKGKLPGVKDGRRVSPQRRKGQSGRGH